MRSPTRRASLLVPIILSGLLVVVAGSSAAKTWTVLVKGPEPLGPFRFVPALLSISYGDTVKWVWVDGIHQTTNNDGVLCSGGIVPALWRAPIDSANTSFSYVFAPPNIPPVDSTYFYECEVHCANGMNGSITLQATGVPMPPRVEQAPFSWGRIKAKLFDRAPEGGTGDPR